MEESPIQAAPGGQVTPGPPTDRSPATGPPKTLVERFFANGGPMVQTAKALQAGFLKSTGQTSSGEPGSGILSALRRRQSLHSAGGHGGARHSGGGKENVGGHEAAERAGRKPAVGPPLVRLLDMGADAAADEAEDAQEEVGEEARAPAGAAPGTAPAAHAGQEGGSAGRPQQRAGRGERMRVGRLIRQLRPANLKTALNRAVQQPAAEPAADVAAAAPAPALAFAAEPAPASCRPTGPLTRRAAAAAKLRLGNLSPDRAQQGLTQGRDGAAVLDEAEENPQGEPYPSGTSIPLNTTSRAFLHIAATAMRLPASESGTELRGGVNVVDQPRALAAVVRGAQRVVVQELARRHGGGEVDEEDLLAIIEHKLPGCRIAMSTHPCPPQDAALDDEQAAEARQESVDGTYWEFRVLTVNAASKAGTRLKNWTQNSSITMKLRESPEVTRESVFCPLWYVPDGEDGGQRVHPAFLKGKPSQEALQSLLRNRDASRVHWLWGEEEEGGAVRWLPLDMTEPAAVGRL